PRAAVDETARDALEDFECGLKLERKDPNAAAQAYARAIAANQSFADAHINLGRLLHEHGQFAQAERVYRHAIAACSSEPLLQYNLAVLLEDMGRKREAMHTYEGALRVNPELVDCLHNLALLCDELGEKKSAIRHLAQYRRLTRRR
ncbi:MAG: tetratricopeptide repeat protein, partial [Burkholderiaceae bacterium]